MTTTGDDYSAMLAQMAGVKGKVDRLILDELLPKSHPTPEVDLLYSMMREYPQRGGKGMRPFICVLSFQAFGGKGDDVLLTASALELFQNWILIHDDIEDDSEMRRGSPALHKKYGLTLALNAGDALHARMWQSLLRNRGPLHEEKTLEIMGEFARMIDETTEGQQMELSWVLRNKWDITEGDYYQMCTKKTSWYTAISPMRLGGIAAGARREQLDVLVEAGTKLGIGFQIHDDVLNLSAGEEYGKQKADDLLEGKRTLILIKLLALCTEDERGRVVELFSLPREDRKEHMDEILALIEKYGVIAYAKGRATELVNGALAALRGIRWPGSADSVRRLEEIARFAVERDW